MTNGDGSRQISATEIEVARHHGRSFGNIVAKYFNGSA